MRWPAPLRQLPSRLFGSAVLALEVVTGLGLVSGTTVALVLGKFLLAGFLALLLLGIVLRFTWRRVRERDRQAQRTQA
jgi:hypothetical protein